MDRSPSTASPPSRPLRRPDPAEPAARAERVVPGADACGASSAAAPATSPTTSPRSAASRSSSPRSARRRRLPGAAALVGRDDRARARRSPTAFTAQAFIITDLDNNQITAFHPGAMQCGARDRRCRRAATCASRSSRPTAAARCSTTRAQLAAAGDPVHLRSGPGPADVRRRRAARRSSSGATWVAVNDYEAQMLAERTGRSIEAMSRSHLRGIVVTLGAHGCELWQQGEKTIVPGVAATEVVDPTGCGDAFRGAMLYGLERGWPLVDCAAPRQPPGRAQDRQPRRPESCAGSHVCRQPDRRPLKFTKSTPKSAAWTFVRQACSRSRSRSRSSSLRSSPGRPAAGGTARSSSPPTQRLQKSDKGRLFSQQQTAQARQQIEPAQGRGSNRIQQSAAEAQVAQAPRRPAPKRRSAPTPSARRRRRRSRMMPRRGSRARLRRHPDPSRDIKKPGRSRA